MGFGLRISELGLLSDFGLRPSGFKVLGFLSAFGLQSYPLNEIKELSLDAKIEPVWNTESGRSPVQLALVALNYFQREEQGALRQK